MTFVMFVCGLFKVGFLGPVDMVAVGLKVFAAYFDLGKFGSSDRRIQSLPHGELTWGLVPRLVIKEG
jgi:hypothetical protein